VRESILWCEAPTFPDAYPALRNALSEFHRSRWCTAEGAGTLPGAMTRVLLAGMAALILLLTWTTAAAAELRTGSAPNRFPQPEESSPIRPELKRADVRYDDATGALQITLTLYDALADPAATSALRPWRFYVEIGDYLNGICSGDDRTWLGITGALADANPAVLDSSFDFTDSYPDISVTKTFSADRTQVTLTATDPRLIGLGTICAGARIFDSRASSNKFSDTFAFLLDGFDAADGALARELPDYLNAEADTVAVRLRPRRGDARLTIRCREIYQATFTCRASGRLRHAPGRPTITMRGRMSFDARGARRLGGFAQYGWRASMRATVNWRRCPADAQKPLRGKPCHRTVRWRGTGMLADALGI
jgi:hypothetical protein